MFDTETVLLITVIGSIIVFDVAFIWTCVDVVIELMMLVLLVNVDEIVLG